MKIEVRKLANERYLIQSFEGRYNDELISSWHISEADLWPYLAAFEFVGVDVLDLTGPEAVAEAE